MLMLAQILAHTPRWVFALFAMLVWLGAKQLFAGGVSLTRIALMPIAMTALSVYGVLSGFGDSPMALMAWAGAAALMLWTVLQRPLPAGTRYDAAARRFQVAGSAVPLALMMGIFFTKYAVGVLLAMHPELKQQAAFALGISALYGGGSGIFAARALRMWTLALRNDRAQAELPAAGA
ncbi:hypothetical protein SAMN05444679_101277 [Variovorax sp. CF079]|nr:hypothetical protein SAMN05444679_101277 [Variovorax sp. CF079]